MIALVTIKKPSSQVLGVVKSYRKSGKISEIATTLMGSKADGLVVTRVKCATEKSIKLKLEIPTYEDLENLEWCTILFADMWKMTYPLKEYPTCSVEYLDESLNIIGHFSSHSPREELSLSQLTPKARKKYSTAILSYITK